MAVVGGDVDGSLVGLKMEVSPELVSGGDGETKMFVLVPSYVRTVRELKSHLATVVLKTTVPFYFYNGEYRIPDEDDVRIFTLLQEPCRVVPVPQRRSVLSVMCSTPMENRSSAAAGLKRVQFFSTPESSDESAIVGSIERRIVDSGTDQIDKGGTEIQGPSGRGDQSERTKSEPNSPSKASSDDSLSASSHKHKGKRSRASMDYDDELSGAEILKRKKEKRRKRKRKKKNSSEDNYTVENMDIGSVESSRIESPSSSKLFQTGGVDRASMVSSAVGTGTSPTNDKSRSRMRVMSSSDEDQAESSFCVKPSTSSSKSTNHSNSQVVKSDQTEVEKPINSHTKDESGVFLTPASLLTNNRSKKGNRLIEMQGKISTGKRQDTPILPRVLKNPGINFDAVKRSLSVKLAKEEEITSDPVEKSVFNSTSDPDPQTKTERKSNSLKSNGHNKAEMINVSDLPSLPEIPNIGAVEVGKVIAFKVLELNEVYTPVVSPFKVARVIDKVGEILSLEYLTTEVKTRSGALEIEDEEYRQDILDDPPQRKFTDLLEVRVVP